MIHNLTVAFVSFLFFFVPNLIFAQESLTLSVSPTLFDMSAEKGQAWQSSVKVINVNKYDLTVYASVVNFVPRGEGGEVGFLPIDPENSNNSTLAEWINITNEPIVIPSEKTVEVPFSIKVPNDASPGGHYAAVLIGTKPLQDDKKQTKVQTSQMVTSLIFTRIAGNIIELGDIREFRSTETFLSRPEATFELRFENKGNVFLQPQGEIKITNMWGEERGIIPINQNSQYGKVPQKTGGSDGIRKFTFAWKGEWSIADIGRYTATVTLGYGTDNRQFTSAKTTFWVIPFKLLFGVLFSLIIFGFLITWLIKLYVRKMLTMAGLDIADYQALKVKEKKLTSRYLNKSGIKFHTPVKVGILDLKQQLSTSESYTEYLKTAWNFCVKNRLFFLGVILIVTFLVVVILYIKSANTSHRAFEVTYVNNDSKVSVNSEEIIYNELKNSTNETVAETDVDNNTSTTTTDLNIALVNRSGTPGVGAEIKLKLEKAGYKVSELEADFTAKQKRTVIIYQEDYDTEALKISANLDNALISLNDGTNEDKMKEPIIIYLGSDIVTE